MLKNTRGIQAGFPWHRRYLPSSIEKEKNNFRNVPRRKFGLQLIFTCVILIKNHKNLFI